MRFLFRKIIFAFIFLVPSVLFATPPGGGTIKGHITDGKTGEPLTGAVISATPGKFKVVSGLDGSFVINNLPPGEYQVTVTMVSFESMTKEVKVAGGDNAQEIIFSLETTVKNLENVVVTGHGTTGNTDASARQIEKASDNVLNILSARTIQLAPDVTVANILRRVSGVTVDRGDDGRRSVSRDSGNG